MALASKVIGYATSYLLWFLRSVANSRFSSGNRSVLFVTGADSSHHDSLIQFLESLERVEPQSEVVVWDLGLSGEELSNLQKRFSKAIFRAFPYEKYPKYFNIRIAAGEYAWKPVAIRLTAEEFLNDDDKRLLVWCDSGNLLFRRLKWIRRYTARHGVFTQFSTGNLGDWTHPDTLDHFSLSGARLSRRNANGAIVAFDLGTQAGREVLSQWSRLAQDRRVIAPQGSDRGNHRQDQAVLGCVLVSMNLLPDAAFRTNWTSEYQTNCDVEKGNGLHQRWAISGRRVVTSAP